MLVQRFVLINGVLAALAMAAILQGWLGGLFGRFTWPMTAVIGGVFLYGIVMAGVRVWGTSRALNEIRSGSLTPGGRVAAYVDATREGGPERGLVRLEVLRMQLAHRLSLIRQVANALVFLGLIGTVIGFIISLSGVDPATVSDVNAVAPMVSKLVEGMGVALYTTLMGAALSLWLTLNHRILATATVSLIGAVIEAGEDA